MLEIDEVINVLKNGEWHNLNEIIERSKINSRLFLAKHRNPQ
jgi:hypothetical protein